ERDAGVQERASRGGASRSKPCRTRDAVVDEEAIAVLSDLRRSAQTLNLAPAGTHDARVVEWQTRQFEGLVVAIPCGFKSRSAHQKPLPQNDNGIWRGGCGAVVG